MENKLYAIDYCLLLLKIYIELSHCVFHLNKFQEQLAVNMFKSELRKIFFFIPSKKKDKYILLIIELEFYSQKIL